MPLTDQEAELPRIIFANTETTVDDAKANEIVARIKSISVPTALDITFGDITDTGMTIICNALQNNPHVTELNFSYSNISLQGIKTLAEMLRVNVTIEKLYLASTGLDDEKVAALVNQLKTNTALTTIDLSGNEGITNASVAPLSALLKSEGNPTLAVLLLTLTGISQENQARICELLVAKEQRCFALITAFNSLLSDLLNEQTSLPTALQTIVVEKFAVQKQAALLVSMGTFKTSPPAPAKQETSADSGVAATPVPSYQTPALTT